MRELDPELYDKITSLSAEADELSDDDRYADALEVYWDAWDLLPEPKHEWKAATWLLVAIGDANFYTEDYQAGRDNLSNAMRCPEGVGNPYIHLRLGQCQFELHNIDRALDELTRAFMGGGDELFEDEDPKYLEFVKKHLK